MASAALGAPSIEVRGSSATIDYFGRVWSTPGLFSVAGAALGAPQARFVWQAHHLEHLHRGLRKSGDNRLLWAPPCFCVAGAALGAPPAHFAWQAHYLEHLRLVLRGRCSTWSTFIE